jgi:hypothetical protein
MGNDDRASPRVVPQEADPIAVISGPGVLDQPNVRAFIIGDTLAITD